MQTTRVFRNGRSQAVRIPLEYRFPEDEELFINKVGDAVMIVPVSRAGQQFQEALTQFTPDFLSAGRPDEVPVMREAL